MYKFCTILFLSIFLLPAPSHSKTSPHIEQFVPSAEIVGKGRLVFWFWDVYDATLYAPDGRWSQAHPFALSLHYLRSISGEEITQSSVDEIRKQGFTDETRLAVWRDEMQKLFPDVEHGTELTGIAIPGKGTWFYEGNRKIGMVADPDFSTYFFNIWLGENTSKPDLRKQLMGL